MADPVKTLVKTTVTTASANAAQGLVTFNAAMATAIATAQAAAVYPAGAAAQVTFINGQQSVYCDPVGMIFDGTNYTYYSAVNYIKYV